MKYYYFLLIFKIRGIVRKIISFFLSNAPLRLQGMQIGRSTYLPPRRYISWPHKIRLGNLCQVNSGFVVREYSAGTGKELSVDIADNNYIDHDVKIILGSASARLIVGSDNFIGAGTLLCPRLEIVIESNCQLAAGCALFDFNHGTDVGKGPMARQECEEEAIRLENDVWLGTGVTVLKGVKIGRGAVVGSGSVVTKSIPQYEIWAGVPARKIGSRI